MKIRKFIAALGIAGASLLSTQAHAGIPVIDASQLAQQVQQVLAWGKQYAQMAQQVEQYAKQIQQLSGARGLGDLVNTDLFKQYMPKEYQTLLQQGVGDWKAIYDASKQYENALNGLANSNNASQAFQQMAKLAAVNRASAEAAYNTASKRFDNISRLTQEINRAQDPKHIMDLSASLQAESAMLQNEANRLNSMMLMAQANNELQAQQSRERSMAFGKLGGLPAGW